MNATKFQIKGYSHDGILLNVSGERDEDGCEISKVTAADSQIDLFDLFQPRELARMAEKIDAQLDREAREEADEARIDAHIWDRDFRIAA
jgi:hypothetical protein